MLSKPTVFVLGAGASMPYHFPSGEGLEREIINSLADCNAGEWGRELREMFNTTVLCTFQEKLRYARAGSVDAFLEHNADFLEVGKACIARALIPREKDHALFEGKTDSWYDCLWQRLRGGSVADLQRQNVTFVTFNYDRSLEHYLHRVITNLYGVDEPTARTVMATMPIIHVHGCLGALVAEGDDDSSGRQYSPALTVDAIRRAMSGIRIVHEEAEGDPVFQQAREALCRAEVVCFMGFGFNSTNVDRLAPETWNAQTRVGTAIGVGPTRQNEICARIGDAMRLPQGFDLIQILRERVP